MTLETLITQCKAFDELVKAEIISDNEDTYPIYDGIIDPHRYLSSKYKILWILKEPYDDFDEDGTPFGGGWDLKEVVRSKNAIGDFGRSKQTFKPMIYASWGILNGFCLWDDMDNVETDPSMLDALKSIAYINVKKLPGYTSTHYSVANGAYSKYRDILLAQIKLINPDIIIGGATLHHFVNDFELLQEEKIALGNNSYHLKNGRIYINAYHPAQRALSQEQYCDDIIMAAKAWAGNVNR